MYMRCWRVALLVGVLTLLSCVVTFSAIVAVEPIITTHQTEVFESCRPDGAYCLGLHEVHSLLARRCELMLYRAGNETYGMVHPLPGYVCWLDTTGQIDRPQARVEWEADRVRFIAMRGVEVVVPRTAYEGGR